ncbi:hypothetical protein TNIN_119921 [Trichonephila inaurata madagascariensis]|uniref:Uncharacterized protein n=1 Tax=Trichonephila inaurata madagascariensis TaxID=2747483 RepID=A0A8X6WXP7_9ARAC|nr:hypothetical protein TNIN_119921 [Trichonephila inaurata madagascariensis]
MSTRMTVTVNVQESLLRHLAWKNTTAISGVDGYFIHKGRYIFFLLMSTLLKKICLQWFCDYAVHSEGESLNQNAKVNLSRITNGPSGGILTQIRGSV